jgi:hypothetical protein
VPETPQQYGQEFQAISACSIRIGPGKETRPAATAPKRGRSFVDLCNRWWAH